MQSVIIADLGLGNTGSVLNMLASMGQRAEIIDKPKHLATDPVVIVTGVGSFDAGTSRLEHLGWKNALSDGDYNLRVIGICLGMQMLGTSSEEGDTEGVGRLPLSFSRLAHSYDLGEKLPIPHMGWNSVKWRSDFKHFEGSNADQRMYFVHSFAAVDIENTAVVGQSTYGGEFVSAAYFARALGFQFHPEKSHSHGRSLLENALTFLENI